MAKMNWDRVRKENQILKHGSASVESGNVTDPPSELGGENQAHDIRCDPGNGDCCHRFNVGGRRALVVIYNLGGDFDSIPREERKTRVLNLFKLMDWGIRKLKSQIESTFQASLRERWQ